MIRTNQGLQRLDNQGIQQRSKEPLDLFDFSKEFIPYIVIGMTFLGLSDLTRSYPTEKVVWVMSKTFEGFALATIAAAGLHFRRLCQGKSTASQSLTPNRADRRIASTCPCALTGTTPAHSKRNGKADNNPFGLKR